MNKKTILISILALVIASAVAVCVFLSSTRDVPDTINSPYVADKADLTFKETVKYSEDKVRDTYTDEKNNEFTYDGFGNFVGYKLNREEADTKIAVSDGVLTEEQVKNIAYKTAVTMYGDIMKEFEFKEAFKTDCYNVTYVKKYGFVESAYCFVTVISDGTVDSCHLSNYYEFSDFDETLLENVTKDILVDYVKKQVKNEHPDYQSFKITSFTLYKINGKYHINMITDISVSDPLPSVIGEDYLYALE